MSELTDLSKLTRQIAKAESDLIEIRTGDIEDQEDGMAVLFTGQWHDSFPRQLVLNQTLSPLEKVTWQTIRLSIDNPSKPGSTPRREELAAMINCSAATVTTARTMLRVCRWITFCKTVRKQGRFVGDIYLFHDHPLSLESTLTIDTTYIQFLQQQTQTSSKRLRGIAGNILKDIDGLQNLSIPNELDVMAARLQQAVVSHDGHQRKNFVMVGRVSQTPRPIPESTNPPSYEQQSKNLSLEETLNAMEIFDQRKIFDMADDGEFLISTGERNFFPSRTRGSNSSSNNNIPNPHIARAHEGEQKAENAKTNKNTKRADDPNPNPKGDPEKTWALAIQHFPVLASNAVKKYVIITFHQREHQIPVLQRMLKKLPESRRDDVLLQYVGRRAAGYHGWTKGGLHNPIAFVGELVKRDQADDFFPDEFALELKKSIVTNKEPNFWDSPEYARKKLMFAGEDVDSN